MKGPMMLSESQELQLIEKVDLRFVLASSEDALERSLDTFFPALLLKLDSPHGSARVAVFNSIKNVMGRISSLTSVKLPVKKLIVQAKTWKPSGDHSENSVGLYSLLFASKGVDRLSPEEKTELIPEGIKGISALPVSLKPRMFHILCKLLLSWKAPTESSEDSAKTFLTIGSALDRSYLFQKFRQFFFLNPLKPELGSAAIPRGYSCPGLNVQEVEFFTFSAGVSFTRDSLSTYKRAIFTFMTRAFALEDRALLEFLVVVSADSTDLSDQAIALVKKYQVPYEDQQFVDTLIGLYIGERLTNRPPVGRELQEVILSILIKSVCATKSPGKVSLICSMGLNSTHYKLRSLSLTFVQHVARHNYEALTFQDTQSDYSVNIASLIRNNLHGEGWPQYQLNSSVPNFNIGLEQRRRQYETLGVVLKQDPQLLMDFSFIEFLFDSLKSDLREFRKSIQETLNSLCVHVACLPEASKFKLRTLAKKLLADNFDVVYGDKEAIDALMYCRAVAIKFVNSAFPFDDSEARLLNVMGLFRENRHDIREESTKGLHPYWFKMTQCINRSKTGVLEDFKSPSTNEVIFPDVRSLMDLFQSQMEHSTDVKTSALFQSFDYGANFVFQTLISQAIVGKKSSVLQDEFWHLRVAHAIQSDSNVRSLVESEVLSLDSNVLSTFTHMLLSHFVGRESRSENNSVNNETFSMGFVSLFFASYMNHSMLQKMSDFLPKLFELLHRYLLLSEADIECAAKIYGIIQSSNFSDGTASRMAEATRVPIESGDFVPAILTSSFTLPLLGLQEKALTAEEALPLIDKVIVSLEVTDLKPNGLRCLDPILKFGLLRLLSKEKRKATVQRVMIALRRYPLRTQPTIQAWSQLSLYAAEFGFIDTFFDALEESHLSKEVDVLFFAGEGMTVLAGGWNSSILRDKEYLKKNELDFLTNTFGDTSSELIIGKLLVLCEASKPSLRKAACIWLLCFVQYLGHTDSVRTHARKIHVSFARFLADNDDLVQDSASRGLGLIYDVSDKDLQEEMLKGLFKFFIDPKAALDMSSGTISSESQLFEPGTMNTGEGSISTYKDLLSLASEAGDPSLVYKFLPLARNTALWSSRKGVAFGLTSIFSKSSVDEFLRSTPHASQKLIPLLYRYRFDPFKNVSEAMNGIWNALVDNTSATITEYFDEILNSILQGIGGKDWRVREASTTALIDLLEITNEKQYQDKLEEIWTMAFRAMDDIKESVRSAGIKVTKILSKILVRSVKHDDINGKSSQPILEKLIPFFLGHKGLNSDAEEIRAFSLETLLVLIKEASSAVRSFAPSLIYEFLLLLSPLEPQVVNYLTMNAEKYNLNTSDVNAQRALGVQQSPIMRSIETLVGNCDTGLLPSVVDKVIKASKKSVGLPSKIGSSKVISLLVLQNPTSLSEFGSKLLKTCFSGLNDRSFTVSEAYTVSFGRVCKVCKPGKVGKYAGKLTEKYFNSEDSSSRVIAGMAIMSMFKYSTEMFQNVESALLPLVFIGMHDSDDVAETYTKIWNESTSSSSGTVNLYLEEIISLAAQRLKSNNFNIKITCAKSVCEACAQASVETPLNTIPQLFKVILETTQGRAWQGKETVVETLVVLARKFKPFYLNSTAIRSSVESRLINEISRTNFGYVRDVIFTSLSYSADFWSPALHEKNLEVAMHIIERIDNGADETASDENLDESNYKKQRVSTDVNRKSRKDNVASEEYKIKLLKKVVLLYRMSDDGDLSQRTLEAITKASLNLFESSNIIFTWRSQIAVCELGSAILERAPQGLTEGEQTCLKELWTKSFAQASSPESIENVKIQCVRFGKSLLEKKVNFWFIVENDLRRLMHLDPSPVVSVELKNAGVV
ncbi:Ecm29p [Lachancea thermotolerans CBS 6340]|uniref:KLTH0E05830p n=1 Tax=Lachancea thermotolerans (strain ATCC 56472 / CBS 6340 / NRRL Y-8284) TaxID=559295 RepID=C5DHN7_LACTC|nr:KLTH0E05830p [Lachancea thermotolerans CBS 6340]CAR23298.1 KLTH0E05830p [Lachancea thermotolerans CBS 6340]